MARLPPDRRLRRTARLVEILVIVALRKAAAEAVTAALRHLAAAGRTAVAADRMAVAVVADLTAETTADSHL